MDHVWFRRELRMRAVPDELRHRKAPLGDVAVERAIRQWAFGRNEMHARGLLEARTEMSQLRDFSGADPEGIFRGEVNRARMLAVQFVELGRDVTPDPGYALSHPG